ncbi:MAG: M28 family peptidase [Gemmatimonadaceae bacterium]
MLAAGHIAARYNAPLISIGLLITGAAAISLIGKHLLTTATATLPWMRKKSTNLVATRPTTGPATMPKIWLVAHIDSKSQTIRMLVRVGAVVLTVIFFLLLLMTLVLQAFGTPMLLDGSSDARGLEASIAALLGAAATLPIVFCFITNESPGALDNATGVATVLIAAEQLSRDANVGILITSAEELGLAGARAFVLAHPGKGTAINCDTIDDNGKFICMTSGPNGRKGIAARLDAASRSLGFPMQVRGFIPGILADSIALTDAGWDSCTVSRGNLGTLARVHTSGDRSDSIRGTGIANAARILAATVEELS